MRWALEVWAALRRHFGYEDDPEWSESFPSPDGPTSPDALDGDQERLE